MDSMETDLPSSTLASKTSLPEMVSGFLDFNITGFSLSKGIGMGNYIASDTFTVGGHSWEIRFYPDGKSVDDNAMYVSVFVVLVSESTEPRARFELTLMDRSGRERHRRFGMAMDSEPYTIKCKGSMWGYKRFFKRSELEASEYLKDDCLQVHCRVSVVASHKGESTISSS